MNPRRESPAPCPFAGPAGTLPRRPSPKIAPAPPRRSPATSASGGYVFRGIRQTWGNLALQGGVDYAHESGFYAGAWLSNTSGNLYANANIEVDLYGGLPGRGG